MSNDYRNSMYNDLVKTVIKLAIGSFLIFFFSWFIAYKLGVNELPIQSEDTVPTILTAVAVVQDNTPYLDKYYSMMVSAYPHPDDKNQVRGLTPYYLREVGGHYISAFPILPAFLSTPIFLIPLKSGVLANFENLAYLAHFSAAFYVSISGGLLYILVKRHFTKSEGVALATTIIYLFGSLNFALTSQGLWQHGFVELFLLAGLLTFFEKKPFLTGMMFGLALLARPTSAIAVGILSLFVLYIYRSRIRDFLTYFLGFLPPVTLFAWYTQAYYLGIQNNGYASQATTQWLSAFPEGLLGMWLSPSKGILIYSPVFVFALVGLYLAIGKGRWKVKENLKYLAFGIIVLLHTLILSLWKHWYGGWSYGYRMAADVIPFLALLIVPYLESPIFKKTKKLFLLLLLVSILVQVSGIIFFDGIWHAAYDNGFENTGWLWSIKDSEFAFNIRRVLVKLGMLDRACPVCL